MIIYTDNVPGCTFGKPLTPAQVYAGTTDFSTILNDIANGNLPTGTNNPFPVEWNDEPRDDTGSPWVNNNTNYNSIPRGGFFNPWENT